MKRKLFPRLSAVIPRLSAVIFASVCLLLVTACKDDDNNASQEGDPDTLEEFVEPEAEPTADAMSVTVDDLTYVFDGSYTGEGKALCARPEGWAVCLIRATTPSYGGRPMPASTATARNTPSA